MDCWITSTVTTIWRVAGPIDGVLGDRDLVQNYVQDYHDGQVASLGTLYQ